MVATSPAMMARDAMLDRRIFMLAPLCHRTAKAIRREANTALVRGERFIPAPRGGNCTAANRFGVVRVDVSTPTTPTASHYCKSPEAAALGALSLFLTRTVVDPDCVSVLGRAIVRIGHPGVGEGVHPAQRPCDKRSAEALAEYDAGAEMGNFGTSGLGRAGAVISLRAVGFHDADRAAGTSLSGEGAATRRNRYRGNAGQYRKT